MNKPKTIIELNAMLVAALDTLTVESKPKQFKEVVSLFSEASDLVTRQWDQSYGASKDLTFWGRPHGQPLLDETVFEELISAIEAYRDLLDKTAKVSRIKWLLNVHAHNSLMRCRWFNQALIRVVAVATYQPTDGPRLVIHATGATVFAPPGKDLMLPKDAVENLVKLIALMAKPETTPDHVAPEQTTPDQAAQVAAAA